MPQQCSLHVFLCFRDSPKEVQQAAKTEVKHKEMPHGKQHENTGNREDITYREMKRTKSPQKRKMPKVKQIPVMLSEDQASCAELTSCRMSQLLPPKRVVRGKRQGTVVCLFYNWKISKLGFILKLTIPVMTNFNCQCDMT